MNLFRKGTKGIKTFKNWTSNIIESINDEIEYEDYSDDFVESYNKLKLEFENDPEVNFPELNEINEFIEDEIIDDLRDSVREVARNQSELKDGFLGYLVDIMFLLGVNYWTGDSQLKI